MATADSLLSSFYDRYYESACAGKQSFPTQASAEQVAQLLHTRKIKHFRTCDIVWTELEAYECLWCGQFHLGH